MCREEAENPFHSTNVFSTSPHLGTHLGSLRRTKGVERRTVEVDKIVLDNEGFVYQLVDIRRRSEAI